MKLPRAKRSPTRTVAGSLKKSNEWRRRTRMTIDVRTGTKRDAWEGRITTENGVVIRIIFWWVQSFSGEGAKRRMEAHYPIIDDGFVG